ncbi:MAG: PDZ domain-containing protein [Pirellulaceae bacterium]
MERRNLFSALLVGLLVGFGSSSFVASSIAHAENSLDHIQIADEVKRVLTEGREFEVKQRWGEALTTYENALRLYPTDSELNRRMRITRLHYELDRRYSDDTFVSSIRRLSESESLSLMEEVATKLETHYVENPDWRELLRCGTSSVQIALLDPTVRKTLGVQASAEQVREMIQAIWSTQSRQSFANRQEAIDFVRWSSRIVSRQMGVSPNAAIFEYVCGAMSSLDPYSTYLTEQQLEDVYSQIKGNFVGLGVELKTDTGTLLISDVISNGPAELAGLRSGDTIVQIDDKVVSELPVDVAADLLKGEQGSVVYLTLKNGEGQNRQVRVRRDRVEVPSVEDVKMLDPSKGIAYLKISSFQETTSRDVDAALWKLLGQGMRSLIIDVEATRADF